MGSMAIHRHSDDAKIKRFHCNSKLQFQVAIGEQVHCRVGKVELAYHVCLLHSSVWSVNLKQANEHLLSIVH
jgi:hypothetical protein